MKYPLILNTNLQIQDKDGEIICGSFKDEKFGNMVVDLLNKENEVTGLFFGVAASSIPDNLIKVSSAHEVPMTAEQNGLGLINLKYKPKRDPVELKRARQEHMKRISADRIAAIRKRKEEGAKSKSRTA